MWLTNTIFYGNFKKHKTKCKITKTKKIIKFDNRHKLLNSTIDTVKTINNMHHTARLTRARRICEDYNISSRLFDLNYKVWLAIDFQNFTNISAATVNLLIAPVITRTFKSNLVIKTNNSDIILCNEQLLVTDWQLKHETVNM